MKNQAPTLAVLAAALLASHATSQAAVVDAADNFTTDTTAKYTATAKWPISSAFANTDMGDGAKDKALQVSPTPGDSYGPLQNLTYTPGLGTIEAADVGKKLSLTFSLKGVNANYKNLTFAFTLDGTSIESSQVSQDAIVLWDEAGTASTGKLLAATWRKEVGQVTVAYTITSADVGKKLNWKIASKFTSKDAGGVPFIIDNWKLTVAK